MELLLMLIFGERRKVRDFYGFFCCLPACLSYSSRNRLLDMTIWKHETATSFWEYATMPVLWALWRNFHWGNFLFAKNKEWNFMENQWKSAVDGHIKWKWKWKCWQKIGNRAAQEENFPLKTCCFCFCFLSDAVCVWEREVPSTSDVTIHYINSHSQNLLLACCVYFMFYVDLTHKFPSLTVPHLPTHLLARFCSVLFTLLLLYHVHFFM